MKYAIAILFIFIVSFNSKKQEQESWIRINQLGYKPHGIKVAAWCSKNSEKIDKFTIIDVLSGQMVYENKVSNPYGAYGPFAQTYRLDFTAFSSFGRFVIHAGGVSSTPFTISNEVYKGYTDFCLRYMRQQRSGFNPFLKDSCHTHDGYTIYGPMPDSTFIDVSGGWHDASDYLQYVATSANAVYSLLAAYRDFPGAFGDMHQANGLASKNGTADVLDEARWGLDWLLKMHPKKDWMFNQLGDDRDHMGMRIPKEDSFYGKGFERPVYFCTGKPQGVMKYKNRATGIASTAGKFSSAFNLGATMFQQNDKDYAEKLKRKALSAYQLGLKSPGVCQTAPCRAPYFYEEDNWSDDMELASALFRKDGNKDYFQKGFQFARKEKVTPWLGADTARHYQWYPFINPGHYEMAKQLKGKEQQEFIAYYREGIEKVYHKSIKNAFYRGIPFIWCSNNLTVAFAMQCYWYRQLTGDQKYAELEQACFDWLFGLNPWGTSMVYGLPSWGDTPVDPHSAFTHLKKYPIDGGLVDGPVYGSIFDNLIGITLYEPDEYSQFQSKLAVYHDDYGDYSTNEPTMDGTAWLIYLLGAKDFENPARKK